jgi:phosphatidylserine synthase
VLGTTSAVAYESVRSELAVMRRDLRWMAPIWIGLSVAVCIWLASEGVSPRRVATVLAGMLGLGVAILPVSWVHYRGVPRGRREVAVGLKLIGLALIWLVLAGAIMYAIVSLLEDG